MICAPCFPTVISTSLLPGYDSPFTKPLPNGQELLFRRVPLLVL
jgi:hypothetical protein